MTSHPFLVYSSSVIPDILLNVPMGCESDLGSDRNNYSKLEGQRRKTSRGSDGSAEA